MADIVAVEAVNVEELGRALSEAPGLTYTYVRQEMRRFGARFRKKFIRERMSGRPGIKWGKVKSVGKNVRGIVTGANVNELRTVLKISKLLVVHEQGATIQGKPWLFLRKRKDGRGGGQIFARVRSVTIPARLGFVPMAQREIKADLIPKIENAMSRAMKVAFERKIKTIGHLIRAATAA